MVPRYFWLIAFTLLGACFSPSFKEGEIQCGPSDACPPGLDCHGGLCYSSPPPVDAASGFALTVNVTGNGSGTVTSAPTGINCPTDCNETFTAGTSVTLTATPGAGTTFVGWSGGVCAGTDTCTVTVDAAKSVTASFAMGNTLMVTLAGNGTGFVTSSPSGISCGSDCMESYPPNTMVTLTALAVTGSTFGSWSGGGCTGNAPCTVTVDSAKMVTATFTLFTYALTVSQTGNGSGTVSSAPAGINCGNDCNEAYDYNAMVTLSAVATTGSTFSGWSDGGCTGTGTCIVTMTASTNVIATFTLQQNPLTVTRAGNGAGTVTSAPAGIMCPGDCTEPYDYDTTVTLSATPATGSVFTGWAGGGCTGTSACVVSVTMATTVTATFTLTTPTLTVAKAGNGAGQLTSTPAGIDCGVDCTEPYNYGSMVTLTATPSAGSTFTGWSGSGCTGTGTCAVTVTAATTATATFTLQTFTLTVDPNGGTGSGVVTSTPAGINCGATCSQPYNSGQLVTLSATPSAGSTFNGWSGGGCGGTGTCVVTVTAATTVTATFTLSTHLLTVQKAGNGVGTVTSSPAGVSCGVDCTELYGFGTAVTLTAAPSAGSTFTGWSGGSCSGTGTCMIPISAATTVTATFTLTTHALTITPGGDGSGTVTSTPAGISCTWNGSAATGSCSASFNYGTIVTLSPSAAGGSSFTSWTGGGCVGTGTCDVTMTAPTTVTPTFTLGTNSMTVAAAGNGSGTVTSTPAGINCGADCSENFTNGTVVTLTATPMTGSTFTGWAGGGCSGTGTCVVTIGAAVTVTATFTLQQFALNVSRAGNGSGTVTSAPVGISCGVDCTENYNYGTTVTLTATASGGSAFSGWTGGGCTGTGTCVVNITAVNNVTATFNLIQHTLTVTPAGNGTGGVTSNPAGISCGGDCSEPYNSGAVVVLTATPTTGSVFSGWMGGGCTGTGTCSVTMSAATAVTATFTLTTHLMTVTYSGPAAGGAVTSSPGTINCPSGSCSQSFNYGTIVTLTAAPAVGNVFNGWSGGSCTGTGTCQVTMTMPTSVTATFTTVTHLLSVNLAGSGAGNTGGAGTGAVTSAPAGITCGGTCSATYDYNTMVTLTQTVGAGTTFTGWSGACTGTGTTCVVTMTEDRSVTATFTLQQFPLTVIKAGTGAGTVTSAPAGINCGATCVNLYDYSTSVTLTAAPAYGSTFTGWSGACSGTATCVTSMTSSRSVTATFTLVPPNRVFVTSTLHTGNLGGFAGADSICAARATAAGFTGTFKAWLSGPSVSARDRLGTATGWVRSDGKPVFDSLTDLLTGRHLYPIQRDELGNVIGPGTQILTATSTTGLYSNNAGLLGNCSDWNSAAASSIVIVGFADVNNYKWTEYAGGYCSSTAFRFYCFQIDNQAVARPPVVAVRRAFTTNASWSANGGLASADALCASEASAAGLAGTFRALLASTANTAIGRFNTTAADLPWANVNNTLLAPTASALAATTPPFANFDAPPNLNAAGTAWGANFQWTGAPDLVTLGILNTSCNNWSSNLSTATGNMGGSGHASIAEAFNWGNEAWACNQTFNLMCLQN